MSHPLRRDAPPGRLYILAAASSAVFLFSCGAQAPPQPPRIEQPERVKDLALAQVGRALELTFTAPKLATDGERLSKPLEVQLFRRVTPRGETPPAGFASLDPWVTLAPGEVKRWLRDDRVLYSLTFSEQEFAGSLGSTFTFTVRTLTRGFRRRPTQSDSSNVSSVTLLDVSGPPENVQAQATEKAIELCWQAPQATLSGRPISKLTAYRIFRSMTGKPDSFELLGETASTEYAAPYSEFDRAYSFKVRAMLREDGHTAESEDSQVVAIMPRDIFPPAAPAGLSAVYAPPSGVELIWTPNSEPDLAGYNVYRREGRAAPERLNKELLRTPILRDASVEPARSYFYRLTAVDLAGNEGAPSEEVSLETRQ